MVSSNGAAGQLKDPFTDISLITVFHRLQN